MNDEKLREVFKAYGEQNVLVEQKNKQTLRNASQKLVLKQANHLRKVGLRCLFINVS